MNAREAEIPRAGETHGVPAGQARSFAASRLTWMGRPGMRVEWGARFMVSTNEQGCRSPCTDRRAHRGSPRPDAITLAGSDLARACRDMAANGMGLIAAGARNAKAAIQDLDVARRVSGRPPSERGGPPRDRRYASA